MSWEFVRGGWITWPSMENDREYRAQAGARAASFPEGQRARESK